MPANHRIGTIALADGGRKLRLTLAGDAGTVTPTTFTALELAAVVASRRSGGKRGRGRRSDATVAGIENGDRALAALRTEYFADLGITRAADTIVLEGRRYEASTWRFDQGKDPSAISDERNRLFAAVLRGRKRFPGSRRVRGVLRVVVGK